LDHKRGSFPRKGDALMMSAIVNEAAPTVCSPVDRSDAPCQLDFVEFTVLLLSLHQKRPRDAVGRF
jgi:hypothetical protein